MNELKHVPDFEGYFVSVNGEVFSNRRGGKLRQLKPWPNKGYPSILAQVNKKPKVLKIHRAVLFAWLGPCPERMQCRHLDGDPSNNQLKNLTWGTAEENYADRVCHGTDNRGEKHKQAKLTNQNVIEIRKRAIRGETYSSIARDFPVSRYSVTRAAKRQGWLCVDD